MLTQGRTASDVGRPPTPAQLAKRRAVYATAQAKHPERWSEPQRNAA